MVPLTAAPNAEEGDLAHDAVLPLHLVIDEAAKPGPTAGRQSAVQFGEQPRPELPKTPSSRQLGDLRRVPCRPVPLRAGRHCLDSRHDESGMQVDGRLEDDVGRLHRQPRGKCCFGEARPVVGHDDIGASNDRRSDDVSTVRVRRPDSADHEVRHDHTGIWEGSFHGANKTDEVVGSLCFGHTSDREDAMDGCRQFDGDVVAPNRSETPLTAMCSSTSRSALGTRTLASSRAENMASPARAAAGVSDSRPHLLLRDVVETHGLSLCNEIGERLLSVPTLPPRYWSRSARRTSRCRLGCSKGISPASSRRTRVVRLTPSRSAAPWFDRV